MVEPSEHKGYPPANQGLPQAFGANPYPQPYHPGMMGGGYAPQSYPLPPQTMLPPRESKSDKTTVRIGNFSLFAIVCSLIFYGVLTFFGGFLLGIWFEMPTPSDVVSSGSPEASVPAPKNSEAKSSSEKSVSQKSGLADVFGDSAEEAVSDVKSPDMPEFLKPLMEDAQDAAAKQAASKTETTVDTAQDMIESTDSAPSSKASVSPQSSVTPQRHGLLSTQLAAAPSVDQPLEASHPQEGGLYSVQLGVYAAQENAENLKNKMQALNYITDVTSGKSPDGSTLYYVHSGSYKTYATASEAAAQFASRNIPGAFVVKISKSGNKES